MRFLWLSKSIRFLIIILLVHLLTKSSQPIPRFSSSEKFRRYELEVTCVVRMAFESTFFENFWGIFSYDFSFVFFLTRILTSLAVKLSVTLKTEKLTICDLPAKSKFLHELFTRMSWRHEPLILQVYLFKKLYHDSVSIDSNCHFGGKL